MLTPVMPGELAAIVTSLEMRERPRARPMPASQLRIVRWDRPAPDKYRTLFRRVGQKWLWFSRLLLDAEGLTAIIHDPAVTIYAVLDPAGIEVGMLELDFRQASQCEIAFFGLIPELSGKGHGRWLMGQATALGWRKDVTCLWVHTCTLDHPSALGFYRAQGFTPFAVAIETFADPRLLGILPRDVAPQVPLLDTAN
jgi:GNAT superfamily N-acetyltransferase